MKKILSGLSRAYPAFGERNFRLYFYGQLVSTTGSWLQLVAQSWLVYEMTRSAEWLGIVSGCSLVPGVLLTPLGSALGDRFDKRQVLYVTQGISMVLALALGVLAMGHWITLWEIVALALAVGVINAVDSPVRNAIIKSTVPDDWRLLQSAAIINSAMVNASKMLGPVLAGALIPLVGVGGAFAINGLTFVASIVSTAMMRIEPTPRQHGHPFRLAVDGFRFALSVPEIRQGVTIVLLIGTLSAAYQTVLPVLAKDVLGGDANTLGWLNAAGGIGAIAAAALVPALSEMIALRWFVIGGAALMGVSLVVLSAATTLLPTLGLLFLVGVGVTSSFSTVRGNLQMLSSPETVSRVMGVVITAFFAGLAVGSIAAGLLAKRYGAPATLAISGLGFVPVTAWLIAIRRKIAHAPQKVRAEPAAPPPNEPASPEIG